MTSRSFRLKDLRPSALRLRRARASIAKSKLFDAAYYISQVPEIGAGEDPILHYLLFGARAGANPNRLFDTSWYLKSYPEVLRARINPLLDFLRKGRSGRRNPGPLFDAARYLSDYPDVSASGANPLAHYLEFGRFEGRSACCVAGYSVAAGANLTPFESWLAANALSDRDVRELRARLRQQREKRPGISVVMPVFEPDPCLLHKAIASVRAQLFANWELWLVNDGGSEETAALLERHARADRRIRLVHLPENRGISEATNAGAAAAGHEVLLFLDQDDELSVDCLAEVALAFAEAADCDLVYSDDDKIDARGRRFDPQFKPHWSPVLLLSWMYLGHALAVRTSVFQQLGGCRSAFDGAQDYDFALRASEVVRSVSHIPKILYHWRAVGGSTALSAEEKPASLDRAKAAIDDALQRRGITFAAVKRAAWAQKSGAGAFEIEFSDHGERIAVIIELRSNPVGLRSNLAPLSKQMAGVAELIVSLDGVPERERAEMEAVASEFGARVISGSTAQAIRQVDAELLLFLSSAVRPPTCEWLAQLAGYKALANVGVVGPRLLNCDGTVTEAGRIHHPHDRPAPAFTGLTRDDAGYLGLARTSRECSSVSRTCLLTSKALFMRLGGFRDRTYGADLAAADYCYRAAAIGLATIVCSSVDMVDGSVPSRASTSLAHAAAFRRAHSKAIDSRYNPNLRLERPLFEVGSSRPASGNAAPVRLAAVSHNLNPEGASNTLFDLLGGLKAAGVADPFVISPADGPLRPKYEEAGIAVFTQRELSLPTGDGESHDCKLALTRRLFAEQTAEVVLANTLRTYWAIEGAAGAGLPSLWAQHESDPWETYFNHLAPDVRGRAYGCFAQAYKVIYVSEATKREWSPVETRRNFEVIRHGVPRDRLDREVGRWTRRNARSVLGCSPAARVLSLVGTVCERKGQLDAILAISKLPPELRHSTVLFIVGAIGEDQYADECAAAAARVPDARIVLTGPVDDPFLYYRAADAALCTSRIESAPRVLIEAMACGLPIITTPVFGIPEIVDEGTNALFYPAGASFELAGQIERLFADEQLRRTMARQSRWVLVAQPGYDEMLQRYERLLREAVNLSMGSFLDPASTFSLRTEPVTD